MLETKMVVMTEKYKWYDPLIDPPLPLNRKERRTFKGRQIIGSGIGAAAGAALGAIGHRSGHFRLSKDGKPLPLGSSALGGTIGLALGESIGSYFGNREILKNRQREGIPLAPRQEEEQKVRRFKEHYPIPVSTKKPTTSEVLKVYSP